MARNNPSEFSIFFAEKIGANVIQACLTGEFEPSYRYYVEHMNELPEVTIKILKKIKK